MTICIEPCTRHFQTNAIQAAAASVAPIDAGLSLCGLSAKEVARRVPSCDSRGKEVACDSCQRHHPYEAKKGILRR